MGCGSCSSGSGCSTGGCGQKGGCATGGCNKLNTFDWLRNMLPPDRTEVDNVYEVRFKNTRKAFYGNVNGLRLYNGDNVVVESDRGFDIGQLSLGGVMAELQMRKKGFKKKDDNIPRIYRKANEADMELLAELRKKENTVMIAGRTIIRDLKLEMKLSDVEYQGDGTKAIFYYIADHRVDFRELIKLLAREFRIRVEMKQIGLRHEAALLGGIGACGRELCCSTWLTDFKTVSTSAARYQNLSLNPMKISGLCGRLKCCLNFELDSYMDALKNFPKVERIQTGKGTAHLQKTDIFKGVMWFSYPDETTWYPLETEEVKQILESNKKGESPESLAVIINEKTLLEDADKFDFVDVVGTNLPELPDRDKRKKRRKKRPQPRNAGGPSKDSPSGKSSSGRSQSGRSQSGRPQSGRPQTGRPQSGKPQTEKPQSGKPQTEKPQSGKPQSGRPASRKPKGAIQFTEKPPGGNQGESKTGSRPPRKKPGRPGQRPPQPKGQQGQEKPNPPENKGEGSPTSPKKKPSSRRRPPNRPKPPKST